MDQFSYLSVLLSIIVGLAITQILQGFRGIVLARTRIRPYWPSVLWAATLLLINVQSWWAMFGLRQIEAWTFAAFAVVLAQTIVQYMLAAIVLPDFAGTESVDLKEHYWSHTRWFFGLFVFVLLISLSKDLVLGGRLPNSLNLAFHGLFIGLCAIALLTRNRAYHHMLAIAGIATFGAYVVLLYEHLR
jgi:hypothetical protein